MVNNKVESRLEQMEKELNGKIENLKNEFGTIKNELKEIHSELQESRSMRGEITKIKDILVVFYKKEIKGKMIIEHSKVQRTREFQEELVGWA